MGKVISMTEKRKRDSFAKIFEVIDILDDYDVVIDIDREDIILILDSLYDLYSKKKMAYQYLDDMLLYFNEIARDVVIEEIAFDIDSISNGLVGCYQLMMPIGIDEQEIIEVMDKVKVKLNGRSCYNEE